MIQIENLVMGPLDNNTYLVKCGAHAGEEVGGGAHAGEEVESGCGAHDGGEVGGCGAHAGVKSGVFVVDACENAPRIMDAIARRFFAGAGVGKGVTSTSDAGAASAAGAKLDAILCTHFHSDHTGGLAELQRLTGACVWAGDKDAENIEKPRGASKSSVRLHEACKIDVCAKDGDVFEIGGIAWRVIHTPGHSLGGICLYKPVLDGESDSNGSAPDSASVIINGKNYGNIPILFSGDTLFAGTTGRTDFFGGSDQDMKRSLEILSELPDETIVLPGHNNFTTIGEARQTTFKRWGVC